MNDAVAQLIVDRVLSRIRSGTLVLVDHTGRRHTYGSGPPHATVEVHSSAAWSRVLSGSLGMARSYADGLWDSPDLVALIRLAARNSGPTDNLRRVALPIVRPWQHARAALRPKTRARSREDIAAHYDLGEELFSRMLDPTMLYSCAVFGSADESLEQAQRAKLDLICDKLELGPSDRVLEIGTGWGGFALHAARTRGCHVTTTTISANQHAYATEQVRRAGLGDRVSVLLEDYRDLRGRFDKLVSIEMIEAVGWRHTGTFLGTCSGLLHEDGAMLLQAITIDDRVFEIEKATRSFIKELIFPGGSLPSMQTLSDDLARHTDMQMVALHDITAHYVPTLARWRASFLDHAEELRGLGYDDAFQRLWNLYLCYCEAGFAERRICDVQLLLTKPASRLRSLRAPGATASERVAA